MLSFLQILQNRAARIVTKCGWYTSVESLLNQCGWLSIRQLTEYHSLLLTFKIKRDKKPLYLNRKISQNFPYNTRLAAGHGIQHETVIKHDVMKFSFIPRTITTWNLLPIDIRTSHDVATFKRKLKPWIKSQIPVQ